MASVAAKDIVFLGSANMQEDDTSSPQGGAVDKSEKITFQDVLSTGTVSVVGEDTGDTSIQITVSGRDSTGALKSEAISTHGSDARTKVTGSQSFERVLKAVRAAASPTGALAVIVNTSLVTGAAGGGGNDYITLEAGDQQADDYYNGWVVRVTSGSAIGQLREVVDYINSTNRCIVRDWDGAGGSNPAATDTYELGAGMVLEHSGQMGGAATTIDEVRRPFYNIASDPSIQKNYYEKIFVYNLNATNTLSSAQITEDASGDATLKDRIEFDNESSLDGSDTTTNRVTDPGGYTFDDGPNDVANSGNLSPNSGQGVWMRYQVAAGGSAVNAEYALKVTGNTT